MAKFTFDSKNDQGYIDIAANGNGSEKAAFLVEGLRRLSLGNTDSLHVIEIGPGGGAALDALTSTLERTSMLGEKALHVSLLELDGIESQKLQNARRDIERFATTSFHQGNAESTDLIFPQGADVINASAVMHEIYSYGDGYHSIDNAVGAITNTLHPNGYFAYRDVFSVDRLSQHERARHIYDRESWVMFARMFLDYYLQNATHPYHRQDDRIIFSQNSKRVDLDQVNTSKMLSIDAPIGLLRELQRHYITMRDYLWRSGALGFVPVLEGENASDWLDAKRGHKRVHYTINGTGEALLEALSEHDPQGGRIIDGDIFDQATDSLIVDFLEQALSGEGRCHEIWNEWLSREGAETYTYMTLNKFMGSVALQSFIASDSEKILLPVQQSDVQIMPRLYYDRFLARNLSNPLKDAKQLVLFKAIDMTDRSQENREETLKALDVLSEHCDRDTLAEIYIPVRKLFTNSGLTKQ